MATNQFSLDGIHPSLIAPTYQYEDLSSREISSFQNADAVLQVQPLIPKVVPIEAINGKLPHGMNFICSPFHPLYLDQWKQLMAICIRPLNTPQEFLNAIVSLKRPRSMAQAQGLNDYLSSLDRKIVLYNGLTEFDLFFHYIVPMMQKSLLNLPYALYQDCNWQDHTVIPMLSQISLTPTEYIQYTMMDKQQQQGVADVQFGSTIKDLLDEIKSIILAQTQQQPQQHQQQQLDKDCKVDAPETQSVPTDDIIDGSNNVTPPESTQVDVTTNSGVIGGVVEDLTAATTTTTTTQSASQRPQLNPGFYFGPTINKLVLSRKTNMGLLAAGFFGFQDLPLDRNQTFDFDYSQIQPQLKQQQQQQTSFNPVQRRSYRYTSIANGSMSNMYAVNGRGGMAPSTLGKLKAMISYFMYFVPSINKHPQHSNISSSPQNQQQYNALHQQLVHTGYVDNTIGYVEFIWKEQCVQLDYVIDTLLNMFNIHQQSQFYLQQQQNAEKDQQYYKVDFTNKPILPLNLLPLGIRRQIGSYITHPKLYDLNEFISTYNEHVTLPLNHQQQNKQQQQQNIINLLNNARNAFYNDERYITSSSNNTNNNIGIGNVYKRWLYNQEAQVALHLMLYFSKQPLHQQIFAGYSGDANKQNDNDGMTWTNGNVLQYAYIYHSIKYFQKYQQQQQNSKLDQKDESFEKTDTATSTTKSNQQQQVEFEYLPQIMTIFNTIYTQYFKSNQLVMNNIQMLDVELPISNVNNNNANNDNDITSTNTTIPTLPTLIGGGFDYLKYDRTYNPNELQRYNLNTTQQQIQNNLVASSGNSTVDDIAMQTIINTQLQTKTAPNRFRIQSYPKKQINQCYLGDFANKYLGGGTLGGGAVQEEQLFSEYAESLIGMMVAPAPMFTETSINLQGVVNHAILGGYSRSTQLSQYMWCDNNLWNYQEQQQNQQQSQNQNNNNNNNNFANIYNNYTTTFPTASILAYDSVPFRSAEMQFTIPMFVRQLNKLFSTLSPTNDFNTYSTLTSVQQNGSNHNNNEKETQLTTFITGNWGCGVFNGKHSLIWCLQLIMCTLCDINMMYCSVGDERINTIHALIPMLFATPLLTQSTNANTIQNFVYLLMSKYIIHQANKSLAPTKPGQEDKRDNYGFNYNQYITSTGHVDNYLSLFIQRYASKDFLSLLNQQQQQQNQLVPANNNTGNNSTPYNQYKKIFDAIHDKYTKQVLRDIISANNSNNQQQSNQTNVLATLIRRSHQSLVNSMKSGQIPAEIGGIARSLFNMNNQ